MRNLVPLVGARGQRAGCAGLSEHAARGVEEVERAFAVGDENALEAQAPEQLGLHLGPGLGDLDDGILADGRHLLLELLALDLRHLASTRNLQLVLATEERKLRLLAHPRLLQPALRLDLLRLRPQLGLLQLGLHLDLGRLGARASLGLGGAHGLHRRRLRLQLQERAARLLRLDLVLELLALEEADRLLRLAFRVVPCGGLLRLGGDLDGLLHRVGKRVACALVHRLHRLDVDVGDDELVAREAEHVAHVAVLVLAEDGGADDVGGVAVEVIEARCRHSGADARRNGLARVSNEVRNLEDFACVLHGSVAHIELPVVR
mmetsp:Transcript_37380/g.99546  ORF Transcript_37380/g.99546 Transcript_37380/m.99546 type:complete len:319 (+) Transcript_37380:307-1263(+)